MSIPTSITSNSAQLPFFCSANSLLFYLNDPSSLSQVLTLYNPYEFTVRYKILCTAPQKYSIGEPQGEIRAQHSIDTVVRLLDTSSSFTNQNVEQRIRIQFFDRRKSQELIGKRDVVCKIFSYKPAEQNPDEDIHDTTRSNRMRMNTTTATTFTTNSTINPQTETRDPWVLFILTIIGIVCAVILVLPTIPDPDTNSQMKIPSYLHMTTNSKVIASYVLGLLTVVFIRR